MRKRTPVSVVLGITLLLTALLGWYAAADTSPSGDVPAAAATAPPPDVRLPASPAAQGFENARVAEAQPRVRRINPSGPPGAGAFEVVLDVSTDAISRAFLVYELAG